MPKEIGTSRLIISRLAQFSRLSAKVIERSLVPLGITLQEMRIAGLLMGEKGITQKDLAEKLSVRAATLSVAITKLEKQGLIKRTVNSADKRVQFLSLKPSGKFDQVDQLLNDLETTACEGISRQDLAVTQTVITQLIKNIENLKNSGEPS